MRIKKGGGQTRRAFAWILALAMVMTNLLSGWTPVMASAGEVLNVTLTVIGDTGNHIDAPDSHTGFVYWLKDEPMQVTLGENNYVAENCKDLIPEILRKNGITSDVGNSDTLYPYSMEKGGVVLDGNFPGWSVIVANADGTFDSNGWGSYPNAAQLSEGCRLIYYWTDAMDDCRVTIDGSNTQLNYDTDAVTDVSFYTETDPDATVSELKCEAGSQVNLKTKLAVPEGSMVSRELNWTSTNENAAKVEPTEGGALITGVGAGETDITASMTNTLGDEISATCHVTVSASGTVYTGLAFQEGTEVSLKPEESKQLTPVFTPEVPKEEAAPVLTWNSTNQEVVTVSDGLLEAVAPGTADITAEFTNTAGQKVSASFEVNVTDEAVKLLKNIKFFKDSKGATPFDVVKELDPATGEMTVGVPENTNMVSVLTELEEHANATIQVSYKNYDKTKDLTSNLENGVIKEFRGTERMLQSDQEARDVTVTVTSGDTVEMYTVHLVRKSLVKSLVVQDDTGKEVKLTPKFNSSKLEYEVTVPDTIASVQLIFAPNNEASKELKVNGQVAEGGVYTLDLAGSKTEAILTAGNEAVIPTEYKLSVKKLTSVKLQFHVSPEDAVVAVYDTDGRVWSKDGVYSLLPGTEYSYNVTKTGYVGQSGKLTLDTHKTLEVQLEKAPESTLPNYDAEWGGFRKDENNQGITQADTPTSKEDVSEKWAVKVGDGFGSGAVSSPILVNGNLYCFAGDSILKVDKETGNVLRSGKMATSSFFAINPPCYANGMILVGIAGQIQAFNADTLESLWIYKDSLGGQTNCTIRYSDGYLYTGFWNAENRKANFVCLSATDEDPSNSLEQKTATWKQEVMGGFYWAGAYTTGDVVMVGTDDGDRGNTSDTSYVYVMNKYTGEVLQKVGPHHGDIRSDISYSNGRIYFTSKGGYLYSYALGSDGRIEEGSRKELQLGSMSTGTPAIE
ncbi:MAG: Ig-like domain-containing protein [Blautia sp.]|uniref:cadherin-like beta sandwich domain-containing protein n=1 Tax=Blautia sp. TaxID=1955243 RepID=UPI002E75C5FB|nr:cadherin-like beta sandwich domain-containing protein [Blautia sp.]MEE1443890.1 Ig-like domain-containing protein [Blautia sp.]